jgi:hypothetical protein
MPGGYLYEPKFDGYRAAILVGAGTTGQVESGVPKWACQTPECRHRWW